MSDESTNLPYRQWQAPMAASEEKTKLGWLSEATETGIAWLKSQRGASDWRKSLDVISGKIMSADIPQYRSQLNTNHLKRNIREIVGVLSKLRPLWGYSSDNPAFASETNQMNLLMRAIFLENDFDRSIKEALQYAAATCTGWIRPVYTRDLVSGEGSIQLLSYGSPCVLPLQLPPSGNFQKAYAMTLLDEMPIFMAHALFPSYQHRLQPTSSLYWYSNEIRKSAQGNIWKRVFGRSQTTGPSNLPDLMIPIRYTTIIDLMRNTTGTNPKTAQMIPMGEPGSTWYYEVPYIGQPTPDGLGGTRLADENDARLYPYRRLLISSETCVMYDGPSFNWHGRSDLIPFSTDHWPWEPLGFSMVRDGYEIQSTITEQERGMADKKRVQLDMPLAYDISSGSTTCFNQWTRSTASRTRWLSPAPASPPATTWRKSSKRWGRSSKTCPGRWSLRCARWRIRLSSLSSSTSLPLASCSTLATTICRARPSTMIPHLSSLRTCREKILAPRTLPSAPPTTRSNGRGCTLPTSVSWSRRAPSTRSRSL